MIFSPTPNAYYRSLIGDQLKDILDLESLTFVIDNYSLEQLNSAEDLKNYFGKSWELWYQGNSSKLIVTFLCEIGSDGYKDHLDKLPVFLRELEIPSNKIIIVAANNQSADNIREYLVNDLYGFEVFSVNFLEWSTADYFLNLSHDYINKDYNYEIKRFCLFSRHYKPWRHYLIGKLFLENFDENAHFSFYNIDPYNRDENNNFKVYSQEIMTEKLSKIDAELALNLNESHFYSTLPIRILDRDDDLSEIVTSDAVDIAHKNSGISITIETLFEYSENDFHPTEKVWKTIGYKKPFIIFSSHHFLKNLKKMGYASFDPFIDESYDSIKDHKKRADAIIKEIKRISELSESDFQKLIENCQNRVDWNANRMMKRTDDFYYGVTNLDPCLEWMFQNKRK